MNLLINTIILFSLLLIIARPAYAYLDPGSGSFILQIILGAVLGGLFTVKIYWQKLKTFIFKIFGRAKSENKHEGKGK